MLVIIDLESTCWDLQDRAEYQRMAEQSEIIELGAVAALESGKELNTFQSFVRPRLHPQLTEFCTQLTTITQDTVNSAHAFGVVYRQFVKWVCDSHDKVLAFPNRKPPYGVTLSSFKKKLLFPETVIMMSWGNYDYTQLGRECRRMYAPIPFQRHVNLKVKFRELFGLKTAQCGLGSAIDYLKIAVPDTWVHHRGIYDAQMVALIYNKLVSEHQFDVSV